MNEKEENMYHIPVIISYHIPVIISSLINIKCNEGTCTGEEGWGMCLQFWCKNTNLSAFPQKNR